MELFAPENLPGVGMGNLASIAAICGLLGLAATSGVLVAQGMIGTVLFIASAVVVLREKPDFGGSVALAGLVLAFLAAVAGARVMLARRARREAAALAGAASDAPRTKAARASIAWRERWARRLAMMGVVFAGASAGFAWAEWNEAPFQLGDPESIAGLLVGVVAASIGGDAAWRFLQGAIRAGGSAPIVGAVVSIVAYALNVTSVYVPFAGAVVFLLAAALAVRLRRRQQQKYEGLRILS